MWVLGKKIILGSAGRCWWLIFSYGGWVGGEEKTIFSFDYLFIYLM